MKLCEKDFREVVEKLPNPVWISDKEGFKTYFNEAWYKLTGRDLKENLGEGWISSVHPEDVERILALYLESIKNRKEFVFEYRIERTDGEHRWVRESGIPFFNEKKEYLGFLGSCVDLTERRESVRAFPMTDSDVLTGLLSKDRFRSLLLQEIERATRYDSLLSVICIDLDRFGEVNELFGFER